VKRGLDLLALAPGWALFGLSLLVGCEVLARKFFTFSVKGVDEIGGYVLAVGSAFSFIYALTQHAHIRVDIAFKYLHPRIRALLHLVAYATLAVFAGLLAWRAAAVLLRSISLDAIAPTPLGAPLVYPQGLWVFGLTVFAVIAGWMAVRLVLTFMREGAVAVDRQFHADRLEEEFLAEKRDALRRAGVGKP